ncbi:cytochrome c oxidase subunit 3 [Algoriphagus persicinus]|uniref:cytochrome c oxidase subunit 3 n=1 Tax=Algoriphagus persicinus TaxID=3108754 RepID=UPI002B36A4C5|nr:cytochrome c oxidase subunit 3 [Algoriphagus sp. E1-3-M2]MEB2787009.1 cytochrome c oxidase subunit 3 [Algoriphagus sp. E1-3-M2]
MDLIEEKADFSSIYYPPGGILLWIIIFLELITFGLGLMGLVYYGRLEPELFHASRLHLNPVIGTVNTVFLLASGYMMANAVHQIRLGNQARTLFFLKLTLMGGAIFVGLKSFEYYEKLNSSLEMGDNMFFTLYWLLTGFHLIHVLVGMVILGWMMFKMRSVNPDITVLDLESGAAFWHMCDLIWLLMFPALYLIF